MSIERIVLAFAGTVYIDQPWTVPLAFTQLVMACRLCWGQHAPGCIYRVLPFGHVS